MLPFLRELDKLWLHHLGCNLNTFNRPRNTLVERTQRTLASICFITTSGHNQKLVHLGGGHSSALNRPCINVQIQLFFAEKGKTIQIIKSVSVVVLKVLANQFCNWNILGERGKNSKKPDSGKMPGWPPSQPGRASYHKFKFFVRGPPGPSIHNF